MWEAEKSQVRTASFASETVLYEKKTYIYRAASECFGSMISNLPHLCKPIFSHQFERPALQPRSYSQHSLSDISLTPGLMPKSLAKDSIRVASMVAKKVESEPSWVHKQEDISSTVEYGLPIDLIFQLKWENCPFDKMTMEARIFVSHRDGVPLVGEQELPFWGVGNNWQRKYEMVWTPARRVEGNAKFEVKGLVFKPESCGHSWTLGFETIGSKPSTGQVWRHRWVKKYKPFMVVPWPGTSGPSGMENKGAFTGRAIPHKALSDRVNELQMELKAANTSNADLQQKLHEFENAYLTGTAHYLSYSFKADEHQQLAKEHMLRWEEQTTKAQEGALLAWAARPRVDDADEMHDDGVKSDEQVT